MRFTFFAWMRNAQNSSSFMKKLVIQTASDTLDSLITSRRAKWDQATVELNVSRSSHTAWVLIRKCGAALKSLAQHHYAVSPNSTVTHLKIVEKAYKDKTSGGEVKKKWRQYEQCMPETEEDFQPFTAYEIERVIKMLKTGSLPVDLITSFLNC